jgi:hypothetical protein
MASKKNRPKSSQAPGQLYGYSVQFTRALAHLLRAHPGQSVSIEHLDDVATSGSAGDVLEQDKSGLAHNPISDRAVGLWKTLRIWVEAIRGGACDSKTRFVLYVAQEHHGKLAELMHASVDAMAATKAIAQARIVLWGAAPKYLQRGKLAADLAANVNVVLGAENSLLVRLITAFSLERGSGSPNKDVVGTLRQKAIPESAVEPVAVYLLGWVKRQADSAIENGKPVVLKYDEFHKRMVAVAKKYNATGFLPSTPVAVTEETIERELRDRTYVRQLKIAEVDDSHVVGAVNDFLHAIAHRTAWSESGDVLEDSFQDFENGLLRAWRNHRVRVSIEHNGKPECDQARLVLSSCMLISSPLQGMTVPSHFVPGSFHSLAETRVVGWHPRYEQLLTPAVRPSDDAEEETEQTSAWQLEPEPSSRGGPPEGHE